MLHTLTSIVDKKARRVGRGLGSSKGAKSGRGTTRHQAARQNIPLWFEGGQGRMVKKYPLLRGKMRNRSVQLPVIGIKTDVLNRFKEGERITIALMRKRGIVKKNQDVKVLQGGSVTHKLTVVIPVSDKAKEIIVKAGGTVQS